MSKVHPLQDNQARAVDPRDTVWLSASAGTGKTQVLSARVLRLLLQDGVSPSQILCLTFTKAGAAEMATRVNEVLADWVRMPDEQLALQLAAIGAPITPATRARARTLFAAVLDCPGGGLRINTIHAFAQWLLAGFPEEAGLSPGTRAMEDRDRALLARETLSSLLLAAEGRGDALLLKAVSDLSLRMGPEALEAWLARCAQAREAWLGPGAWAPPLRGKVERLLGLPEGIDEAALAVFCADDAFAVDALRCCLSAYGQWNGKKGMAGREIIADWLAASPAERLARVPDLHAVLFTQKDTVRDVASLEKFEEHYAAAAEEVLACALALRQTRALIALADWLTPALTLGRAFALAWDEAKSREGLIDFDDQIRQAADLLNRSELAEWIRYKLDRRFDHILIDEAQDTNQAQWQIIEALTGDFFAGAGQHGAEALRTLFVVGDYKQAIFRFQGTSPENFERARSKVKQTMSGLAENVVRLRQNGEARELVELDLGRSYRTSQPVLDFVNRAIAHIGPERFGLNRAPDPHVGKDDPGTVTFWRPVGQGDEDSESQVALDESDSADENAPDWLSRPDRQLADRIARQVAEWMDTRGPGFALAKGTLRRAEPGDVMILVRKRRELAGLIVARLHAHGVAVAGVDRLRLGAPLAVRDLVAALRFAAQPLDDLTLAALLVSPLLGWSQEQLLEHGYRPERVPLWEHLRRSRDPFVAATVAQLVDLLSRADYAPPQALLQWLLVGPWRGRRKLIARLGDEAADPVDELVNAAHAYTVTDVPSLAGFLHWFDAGDGELKREAEGPGNLVRVMTVHGSKGLQAPIVILADAAGKPGSAGEALSLAEAHAEGTGHLYHASPAIPLPPLRKEEKCGRIAEAEAEAIRADLEEHWRLLYVAMTRAEEALFVTGSLGSRETMPAEDSWYARLAQLVPEEAWREDEVWTASAVLGRPAPPAPPRKAEARELDLGEPLPPVLLRPVGEEPRPPRPLAPSALGEEAEADPPFATAGASPHAVDAARRGTLIHKLLERLPELAAEARAEAASRWLARNAADLAETARAEMAEAALAVLAEPAWADLFGPAALAEVPIAATVGSQVIAGTIDRLLVTAERVRLVDYKTARRPAARVEEVPPAILRQMAAYAAALEAVYPGREVEIALLYTQAPRLIPVPAEVLARHKPGLAAAQ